MCDCTRRFAVLGMGAVLAGAATRAKAAASAEHQPFVDAAFKMKDEAIRAGDQPYGAVVVKDGRIIGFGPSRVVTRKDWTAHAEREAIREAQARLGTPELAGCVMYSSSRPCAVCERAAADANIARMLFGPDATDAGPPVGRSFGPTR
jgi:tRNA(Arg) A34 adenosine deaminase TadA